MSDRHFDHLVEANRIFADQIKTADQKAAYIFTFVLALVVWSAETRRAFSWEHLASAHLLSLAATMLLLGSIAVALIAAICVVLPRSRPGRSVLFWGAWPAAGERLEAARERGDSSFVYDDYLQNTTTLAAICQAKYRLVRLAFRSMIFVVTSYGLLLVIG
ncbi:Pycsar system effector family protein [Jiella sp. M17.18]|uniref:Pycsar system effector family protein n=1 Tax=Jiella sp. M17.18 TaxID=3234247 RepID=UPI0034DEB75D